MKDPLGVSPSKGNQGTTRGKEKNLLTSVGIEPTTSGLDLPLLCRLSYEVGQRKSGTILGDESRRSVPRVVCRFPLLGLTPSGSFTSELISVQLFVFIVLRGATFICTLTFSSPRFLVAQSAE